MLRIIFTYLILLIPCVIYGQNLYSGTNISLGDPYPVVDNEIESFTNNKDSAFIYSVKVDRGKLIIQKFKTDVLTQMSKYENTDLPDKFEFQRLVWSNSRLYFMYSVQVRKTVNSIYVREIDQNTLKLKEVIKLITVEGEVKPINYLPDYSISTSFDKSKLLITYSKKIQSADESDVMGFYVFNAGFKKEWGVEMQTPYSHKDLSGMSYQLENDGRIYLTLSKKNQYEWVTLSPSGTTKKLLNVHDSLSVNQFAFRKNKEDNIVLIGYYGKQGLGPLDNVYKGIVVFEIEENGNIVNSKISAFPKELVNNVLSKGDSIELTEKNRPIGIKGLKLARVEMDDDENIFVIGEVNYLKREYDLGAYKNINHSEDIVLVKINSKSEILWWHNMNKHQMGSFHNIHSINNVGFRYYFFNDTHFMLYADHEDNAYISDNRDKVSIHRGGTGGFITLYAVNDLTGERKKYILFDVKDINGISAYQFHMPNIVAVGDLTFITEVYIKKKRDALLRFKIDLD